jgi:hypothetical protein
LDFASKAMLTINHLGVTSSSLNALVWDRGLLDHHQRKICLAHSFLCNLSIKLPILTFILFKNQKSARKIQSRTIAKLKARGALHSTTDVCTKLKEISMATTPQIMGWV